MTAQDTALAEPETMARQAQQRHLAVGYGLAALGAALFASKAIFVKLAYLERTDASLLLALRMAFALPFFLAIGVYAVRRRRQLGLPSPSWRTLLACTASGFIGYYLSTLLDFEGLTYISAQLERLVLFSYPLFVMVLGALFFGGRITMRGVIAGLITYAGLAAAVTQEGVSFGGWNTLTGVGLVLAAAFTFAFYQLLAKGFIEKMGSLFFTAVAMTASSIASIAHYVIVSGGAPAGDLSGRFLVIGAALAVFATVVPSFLINAGLGRIGPQATAMIGTLSPLFTILLAVMILGEPFTLMNALGTALVLVGIGYYTWADMRAARLAPET
jgi:drug/metabolite transporter (DMT)-like permease